MSEAIVEDLDSLVFWAKQHGAFMHESLKCTQNGAAGLSLHVREESLPIPAASRLLTCPYSLSLSCINAYDTHLFPSRSVPLPESFLQQTPLHTVTVFFLSQQYLLREDSFWWPYIRALPQPDQPDRLGTPLYFAQEDILWLKGTNLERGRSDREDDWKTQFHAAIASLKEAGGDVEGHTWYPSSPLDWSP